MLLLQARYRACAHFHGQCLGKRGGALALKNEFPLVSDSSLLRRVALNDSFEDALKVALAGLERSFVIEISLNVLVHHTCGLISTSFLSLCDGESRVGESKESLQGAKKRLRRFLSFSSCDVDDHADERTLDR